MTEQEKLTLGDCRLLKGGLLRCCEATLNSLHLDMVVEIGQVFTCDHCGARMKVQAGGFIAWADVMDFFALAE